MMNKKWLSEKTAVFYWIFYYESEAFLSILNEKR